jgi:hypothetical protein
VYVNSKLIKKSGAVKALQESSIGSIMVLGGAVGIMLGFM